MKKKIYLKASFISYLTGEHARDLVIEANKQISKEWWLTRQKDFALYISEFVIQEPRKGDPEAAKRRILILVSLPILAASEEVLALADLFLKSRIIPKKRPRHCPGSCDYTRITFPKKPKSWSNISKP